MIRLASTLFVSAIVTVSMYAIVTASKTEAHELDCTEVDFGTYDYTHVSTNRPTRNNNPGNIRKTGVTYYGETSNDPAFESFAAPEWGYAAMFDLLDRLYTGLTLSEAIHKWAPPVENDTQRYIDFVAGSTDLHEDKFVIDVNDERIIGVAKYMSILEGMKGFSDDDVTLGYMVWEKCYNVD